MKDFEGLIKQCKGIIKCDTARISAPCDRMFLIIGFLRNTRDDSGRWYDEEGNPCDWDYIHEITVASGYTEEELLESLREYVMISDMTPEQYFNHMFVGKWETH